MRRWLRSTVNAAMHGAHPVRVQVRVPRARCVESDRATGPFDLCHLFRRDEQERRVRVDEAVNETDG